MAKGTASKTEEIIIHVRARTDLASFKGVIDQLNRIKTLAGQINLNQMIGFKKSTAVFKQELMDAFAPLKSGALPVGEIQKRLNLDPDLWKKYSGGLKEFKDWTTASNALKSYNDAIVEAQKNFSKLGTATTATEIPVKGIEQMVSQMAAANQAMVAQMAASNKTLIEEMSKMQAAAEKSGKAAAEATKQTQTATTATTTAGGGTGGTGAGGGAATATVAAAPHGRIIKETLTDKDRYTTQEVIDAGEIIERKYKKKGDLSEESWKKVTDARARVREAVAEDLAQLQRGMADDIARGRSAKPVQSAAHRWEVLRRYAEQIDRMLGVDPSGKMDAAQLKQLQSGSYGPALKSLKLGNVERRLKNYAAKWRAEAETIANTIAPPDVLEQENALRAAAMRGRMGAQGQTRYAQQQAGQATQETKNILKRDVERERTRIAKDLERDLAAMPKTGKAAVDERTTRNIYKRHAERLRGLQLQYTGQLESAEFWGTINSLEKQESSWRSKAITSQQKANAASRFEAQASREAATKRVKYAEAQALEQSLLAGGFRGAVTEDKDVVGKGGRMQKEGVRTLRREAGGQREVYTIRYRYEVQGANQVPQFATVTKVVRDLNNELGGLRGQTRAAGRDFITNTAHITAWAAGAAVLYGTLGLVRKSLSSLVQSSYQTARLSQVFSGIGGSASDLRDQVMTLAAAYGRTTNEAMEAAIAWSRLQLKRAQVAMAVRTSLMAANVAEISAADATQHLSAIMLTYKLRIEELPGVLGKLNYMSNTYAVTVADLFQGISRVGAVAAEAGLSFTELSGILAATVGSTKQSGANIGNALKSVMVAIGNPAIQQMLKNQFGVSVRTAGGNEMKDFSDTLLELYTAYNRVQSVERQMMVYRIAGKTQTSRLTAVLDNYIRSQVLAINAQLNLNSAEEENAKITASLKAQLTSLISEWERFVVVQSTMRPLGVLPSFEMQLSGALKAMRNLVKLSETPVGGGLFHGMMLLTAAMGARLLVTHVRMAALGKSTGMIGNTFNRAKGVIHGFNMALRNSATMMAEHYGWFGKRMLALDQWGSRVQRRGREMIRSNQQAAASGQAAGGTWVSQRSRRAGTTAGGIGLMTLGTVARTAGSATAALGSLGLSIVAIEGAFWAFNKVMNAVGISSDESQAKLDQYQAKAESAGSASQAASDSVRLLSTSISMLKAPTTGNDERARILENLAKLEMISAEQREAINRAGKEGNQTEVLRLLTQARTLAGMRQIEEVDKRINALMEKRTAIESELQRARIRWLTPKSRVTELENQFSEVTSQITSGMVERTQQAVEFSEDDLPFMTLKQKFAGFTQSISEFYDSIPGEGPFARQLIEIEKYNTLIQASEQHHADLDAQLKASFQDQQNFSDALKDIDDQIGKQRLVAFRKPEPQTGEYTPSLGEEDYARVYFKNKAEIANARAELEQLQARREKLKKDQKTGQPMTVPQIALNQEMAAVTKQQNELAAKRASLEQELQNKIRIRRSQAAQQWAQMEADSASRGLDTVDRLLQRRRFLSDPVMGLAPTAADPEERRVAYLERINLLKQTELDLSKEHFDLEKKLGDLQQENLREFNEGVMASKPGEMLQRFYASKLAQRKGGLSMGQWFALDPSMREMVGQLNPAYSADGRSLIGQRNRLNRAQPGGFALDSFLKTVEGLDAKLRGMKFDFDLPKTQLSSALGLAASDVATLGASAMAATAALDTFANRLNNLGAVPTPAAPAPNAALPQGLQAGDTRYRANAWKDLLNNL